LATKIKHSPKQTNPLRERSILLDKSGARGVPGEILAWWNLKGEGK